MNLYVLFTEVSCDKEQIKEMLDPAEMRIPKQVLPKRDLIKHHLGQLLASDLPDISSLCYCVKDQSEDLVDVFDALDHQVMSQMANLPQKRGKDINWRGKLILAELRDWCRE